MALWVLAVVDTCTPIPGSVSAILLQEIVSEYCFFTSKTMGHPTVELQGGGRLGRKKNKKNKSTKTPSEKKSSPLGEKENSKGNGPQVFQELQ